uniref:Sodium/calcium exchanger membrane region domain-containing protein n=1 Tax=Quercus lobata TaxID=97700 RepID=A0A7N2M804_QUELO
MGGEAEDQQSPLLRSCSSPEEPLERTDETGSLSGGLRGSSILTFLYVVYTSIKTVVFSNKLNTQIVFGPTAILVQKLTDKSVWVFFLSLVGITPLAERLGYATDFFLHWTYSRRPFECYFWECNRIYNFNPRNEKWNDTCCSAVIIGFNSVKLVAGTWMCILLWWTTAVVNSKLLFMAVMGLLFPAVLHCTHTEVYFGKSELALSRFSSCIMLVTYAAYLFFQLKSRRNLNVPLNEDGYAFCHTLHPLPLTPNYLQNEGFQIEEGSYDDEAPQISKWESVIWLLIISACVSILSEYLVDTIERASIALNMPVSFISVILLPLVGNAVNHASAITFAMKEKLDITLGISIGSSTQIALFVGCPTGSGPVQTARIRPTRSPTGRPEALGRSGSVSSLRKPEYSVRVAG